MAATNAREFRIRIDGLKKLPREKVLAIQQKVALQLLRGVVLRSPVDTGRFRGNWSVSVDVPAEITFRLRDKAGHATIAKGTRTILSVKGLHSIFLENNLPYAMALERGHSRQAPLGMVAVTVASVRAQFRG